MESDLIAKAREGRTKALEALSYRQLVFSNVQPINQRVARTRQASPSPNAWASIRNIFQQPTALQHDDAAATHGLIEAHN